MSDQNQTTITQEEEEERYRSRLFSCERAFRDALMWERHYHTEACYSKLGVNEKPESERKRWQDVLQPYIDDEFDKDLRKKYIMKYAGQYLVPYLDIDDVIDLSGLRIGEILGMLDAEQAGVVIHEIKKKIANYALNIQIPADKIAAFADLSIEEVTELSKSIH